MADCLLQAQAPVLEAPAQAQEALSLVKGRRMSEVRVQAQAGRALALEVALTMAKVTLVQGLVIQEVYLICLHVLSLFPTGLMFIPAVIDVFL